MTVMSVDINREIPASDYDRTACEIGIVHIGYGAFHRAHMAVYIDEYMQKSGDLRWGIAAVNLRASEAENFAESAKAKGGYVLKTTTPDGEKRYQRIRPHCAFSDWTNNQQATENLISRESVFAVSITVTESGYYLNNDFSLNLNEPVIVAELQGGEKQSVYAFLTSALKKRQHAHGNPLNLLCCDNIRANGKMLERSFCAYLKQLGESELLNWVERNVSFPCSMVDRITPRASDGLRGEISAVTGSLNDDPIHAETFIQWVLEDHFKAPMPDIAKVGVEVVEDVDPYEEAKIRILNGGHTGLCYFGTIKGHTTYDQAILDPELSTIFDNFEKIEVLPGLNIDLPFDKADYLAEITARFSNQAIADQLERICMDGYSKMPIFIRPTLESCLHQGIVPVHTYLCVASWYVYARRFANGQLKVNYHDPFWQDLKPLLADGAEAKFAQSKQLWAELPNQYPAFIDGMTNAIREVEKRWPV
ncbi:mannitol dehydrogenase family protein [Lentilitoribacter sp. EG35]|uniref:mannitol dehydrogenase family protein n=1 Tax=Lentilitoribacter sp. EG35 TaxID=3234192 RepID=UPI0034613F78